MLNESPPLWSTAFLEQLENNFQQSNNLIKIVSDCAALGDSTFTAPESASITLIHALKILSSIEKQIEVLLDEIRKSRTVKLTLNQLDELDDNQRSAWHIIQIVADYAEYADNVSPNNRSMYISLNHALELLDLVRKTTLEYWRELINSIS